jgi:hypothetical protein
MRLWQQQASNAGGGDIPPAGAHPAVIVALVDLGSRQETYKNKDEKTGQETERTVEVRKILVAWELTGERMSGSEHNHVMCRDYTLATGPKSALRKMMESLRGRQYAEGEGMEVDKLLGHPCQLNVTHGKSAKGNTYAKIDGVGPLMKGVSPPPPGRKPFAWEIGSAPLPDLSWMPYLYGGKVEDLIKESPEWKQANGRANGQAPAGQPPANGVAPQQPPQQETAGTGAPAGHDAVPF